MCLFAYPSLRKRERQRERRERKCAYVYSKREGVFVYVESLCVGREKKMCVYVCSWRERKNQKKW